MIGNLISAFSSLVALGALLVSFMAHRHQVARGAALDVRERAVEQRELEAERRESRMQASMVEIRAAATESPLLDGWVTHNLEILNPSNQPITDLSVTYRDTAVADVSGSLGSGAARLVPLARVEGDIPADWVLRHVTVFFTDAAGTRWHRDGTGGLRRGALMPNGEWRWADREDPVITPSRAYDIPGSRGPAQGPDWAGLAEPRRRRAPILWVAGVALALAAMVALVLVVLPG